MNDRITTLDVLYRLAALMALMGIAILLTVGFYVMFVEKSYLSYPKLPFPVQIKQLRPGDVIPMEITRCNSDKIDHSYAVARAIREVTTNRIVPMDPIYSMIPSGCHTAMPSRVHKIPLETEPGRYEFYGGAETHGIVRTFDVIFRSEQFEVLQPLPAKSLQGPAGPAGPKGAAGSTGAVGATGATGAAGKFWGNK